MSGNTESLSLKRGTLKGWKVTEDSPAFTALKNYFESGSVSAGAMAQRDSAEQKQAIIDIIDLVDADKIYLDWDGVYVSKEEAKKYVLEYDR